MSLFSKAVNGDFCFSFSYDSSMASISEFHHQKFGNPEGKKLVFLHGLMGSGGNWRSVAKSFQDEFEILTYDQRGHGRSPHFNSYETEDYCADLFSFLEELAWEKIHLVGHSMGGRNAFVFAHLHPERVEKLVIEDISPAPNAESADRIRRMINLVPTPFGSRNEAKDFFQNKFPKALLGNPQAQNLADYFYTNMAAQKDGTTSWRFHMDGILETMAAGRQLARWNEVESLSMPTLWMRGSRSEDLPLEDYQKVLSLNSHIEGVEIDPSGHWIHFDQPEKFVQALKSFFSQ